MPYFATEMGTSFAKPQGAFTQIVRRLASKLSANPDYTSDWPSVRQWIVEFDDEGFPWREVGLDESGNAIVAGPDSRNYGFWNDTNTTLRDLVGHEVSKEAFEAQWDRFYASRPTRVPSAAVSNQLSQRTALPPLN